MKRLGVWCAVWLGLAGTASAAEMARQYSADMVMQAQGQTVRMRLYVDGGKARSELEMPSALQNQPVSLRIATIARPDLNTTYILYLDEQTYEERPLDPRDAQLAAASDPNGTAQALGTETVHGQLCTKYQVTYENTTTWVWATQDEGLPVKLQLADGSAVIEFTNVQKGPQPSSLFEIPAGYRKGTGMAGMSGLLKQMAPGLQLPAAGAAGGDPDDSSASDEVPPELMEQMQKLMNR